MGQDSRGLAGRILYFVGLVAIGLKYINSPRIPNLKVHPHQPANSILLLYQLLQNIDYYHNPYSPLLTSENDVPTGTYGSRRPACVCAGNTRIEKSLCLPGI
jgi:hypothetical protein